MSSCGAAPYCSKPGALAWGPSSAPLLLPGKETRSITSALEACVSTQHIKYAKDERPTIHFQHPQNICYFGYFTHLWDLHWTLLCTQTIWSQELGCSAPCRYLQLLFGEAEPPRRPHGFPSPGGTSAMITPVLVITPNTAKHVGLPLAPPW